MITGPANVPTDWNRGKRDVLDAADIRRIRAAYAKAPNHNLAAWSLASTYGVSIRTIYRVVKLKYSRPRWATAGPGRCQNCGAAIWFGRDLEGRRVWRDASRNEHRCAA